MSRKKSNKVQIQDRREKVWELHARGHTVRQIADLIGSTRSTVGKDIQIMYKEHHEDNLQDIERHITKENAHLSDLRVRAMDQLYKEVVIKKIENGEEVYDVAEVLDEKLLDKLIKISDRIAKLNGLDAALKIEQEINAEGAMPSVNINLSDVKGITDNDSIIDMSESGDS